MKRYNFTYLLAVVFCFGFGTSFGQDKTIKVKHFDKIIVSPHIEVTLQEGSEESVMVKWADISDDKINVEVNGNTLRVYLDGAKVITKQQKVRVNGWDNKHSIYEGTMAKVVITYKDLRALSLRGEEKCTFKSPIEGEKFTLKVYGESDLVLDQVKLQKLRTIIYGDVDLTIKSGTIEHQKYLSYGDSDINAVGVSNDKTKVTAYGASRFKLNVTENLAVTALGESEVSYKGNPNIGKGLVIGEVTIKRHH